MNLLDDRLLLLLNHKFASMNLLQLSPISPHEIHRFQLMEKGQQLNHSLVSLPTIRPNASRIIISWNRLDLGLNIENSSDATTISSSVGTISTIAPETMLASTTEQISVSKIDSAATLNASITVNHEAKEQELSSLPNSGQVTVRSNATIESIKTEFLQSTTTKPTIVTSNNNSEQTSRRPNITTIVTRLPWRRPSASTTSIRPKYRPAISTKRPASKTTEKLETSEDFNEILVELIHTTQRPYDSSRDCGQRPMDDQLATSSISSSIQRQQQLASSLYSRLHPHQHYDRNHREVYRQARVVGGRDSQLGEFPWSVLIRETTLLGLFVKTKCGGVLIDPKWVLTAAHCQPGMFGSLIVVVGESDLSGANRYMGGSGTSSSSNNRQVSNGGQQANISLRPSIKKVKRMIVHRDYNPSNFDNDIALLELESAFQVQPHVNPICLPEKYDEDLQFIGQQAMVAGWGKLSFGGPVPNVLQVAKLPVIGNKQCQQMYHDSGHMKIISDSFLCAGYANGGQDSCEGDSGGPLQVQRPDGRWMLLGTVSHGIKCAEPNLPGIYIRTGAYLPWIKAVTYHQDYNKRYGH